MDLPHSGYLKQSVELLRVETDLFNLYIKGKPFHPTVEALHLHRSHDEWVNATLDIIPVPGLALFSKTVFSPVEHKLTDAKVGLIYPCFFENQDYELVIEKSPKANERAISFYHDNVTLRSAVKPLGAGQNLLSGVLNFRNEVGFTDLEIRVEDNTVLTIRLEIFPSKMDYQQDYQRILEDVNAQVYNLAFDFLRRTYNFTGLKETQHTSLTEFFTILQHIFIQLVSAVERIQTAPHQELQTDYRVMDAGRVKKAGRVNLPFLAKRPHLLVEDDDYGFVSLMGKQYRPTHLIETKRKVNYNTLENRFLRWMLIRIMTKLKDIRRRILRNDRVPDPVIHRKLDNMLNQLNRLISIDFLADVGELQQMSVTLVLQMAPGYRDVYRFYLMLLKGLSIQGDLFRLSLKDLAQLYEYWCFLKIHGLLKQKYELLRQDIIRVERSGLFVTLNKSQKASVTYRNPKNGEQFTLYYNALPSDVGGQTPTLGQRPDNVLTLRKKESSVAYNYIFDAKYRLNPAYEGTPYAQKYGQPGPEEDDINTMHRYRDAIVYEDRSSGEFERSMFGAYVLFPYADEEWFREHRFYRSIKKINVGAFPFLPNATSLMEEFLDELILDSPEKAYERSTRPRGTKTYYSDKLSGKNVLIGSLRNQNQLEVCLKQKFYHIPLRGLQKAQQSITRLEYIGLYQSKSVFKREELVGVQRIGKILRWEVVPRKEIREFPARPGTENELYVRFWVGMWEDLPRAIKPGGYGIYTYLLTSKYILDRAEEIAELRLDTEEQLSEWREKRRVGKVEVKLDDGYVDRATRVLGVKLTT